MWDESDDCSSILEIADNILDEKKNQISVEVAENLNGIKDITDLITNNVREVLKIVADFKENLINKSYQDITDALETVESLTRGIQDLV